ncbi:uncharacterized protein [Oscarella lobularis]|uniref:uncharacterized protein isoform X2 n=1 Tax=Oscarella lobularis TaxID=121494 RepID=UPI00331410DD
MRVIVFALFAASCMSSWSHSCHRDRSRLVRRILDERFFPHFKRWQGRLASSCPFRRSRDLYYEQERHKTSNQYWNCEYCGKSFYTEHFLDVHFEKKHADRINSKDAVCLADYCDIMRCDVVADADAQRTRDDDACAAQLLEKLKTKCESLMNFCVDFRPHESRYPHQIYEALVRDLCGFLTCERYWDQLDDASSWTSTWWFYILLSMVLIIGLSICTVLLIDPL